MFSLKVDKGSKAYLFLCWHPGKQKKTRLTCMPVLTNRTDCYRTVEILMRKLCSCLPIFILIHSSSFYSLTQKKPRVLRPKVLDGEGSKEEISFLTYRKVKAVESYKLRYY